MRLFIRLSAAAMLFVIASSCETVRPYQMQYLKDNSMQPNPLPLEKIEAEAETYREGASGGMGGKTGGGCGCN